MEATHSQWTPHQWCLLKKQDAALKVLQQDDIQLGITFSAALVIFFPDLSNSELKLLFKGTLGKNVITEVSNMYNMYTDY